MTPDTVGDPTSTDSDGPRETGDVDDQFLARSALGGDSAALTQLIARYDKLVRYTVYRLAADRCRRDPQWLDSIASDSWAGFVQSLNRSPDQVPRSVAAFVVRIARNKVASELRKKSTRSESLGALELDTFAPVETEQEDPATMLSEIEDLSALRSCIEAVGGEDRVLMAHLEAITDRRWKTAAEALGIAESTLRSRWAKLLERLRECVTEKTGSSFAPEQSGHD